MDSKKYNIILSVDFNLMVYFLRRKVYEKNCYIMTQCLFSLERIIIIWNQFFIIDRSFNLRYTAM